MEDTLPSMPEPTRRTFLTWITGLIGAVPVLGPLLGCVPPKFILPADERSILAAATERLIPSGDSPGAREANAIEYVCRALSTKFHKPIRPLFMEGARRIDRVARREYGTSFQEMDTEDQDRLLDFIQRGGEGEDGFDTRLLFHKLLELTLEGFLGDPSHGGNRNEVGWRFIGYSVGSPRPGTCLEDHDCSKDH